VAEACCGGTTAMTFIVQGLFILSILLGLSIIIAGLPTA
jgi:hypothetical protein